MIYQITGAELKGIRDALDSAAKDRSLYSLRIGIDGDSLKVKVNGGMWSPPIGTVEVADRPHTCQGAGEDTFDLHTLHSLPVEAIDRIIQVATYVRSQKGA